MSGYNIMRQKQSDSEATKVFFILSLYSEKALKNFLLVFFFNTYSIIFYGN